MNPAGIMQFDYRAWLSDPAIGTCSPATRGVFVDWRFAMYANGRRGFIIGTAADLQTLGRCTSPAEVDRALSDLILTGAAEVFRTTNPEAEWSLVTPSVTLLSREKTREKWGCVTDNVTHLFAVVDRQMFAEYEDRELAKKRQEKRRRRAAGIDDDEQEDEPVTELSRTMSRLCHALRVRGRVRASARAGSSKTLFSTPLSKHTPPRKSAHGSVTPLSRALVLVDPDDAFEAAWAAYGKKGGKPGSSKRYTKAIETIAKKHPTVEPHGWLLDRITLYRKIHHRRPARFFKDFENWLSTGGYEYDETAERAIADDTGAGRTKDDRPEGSEARRAGERGRLVEGDTRPAHTVRKL